MQHAEIQMIQIFEEQVILELFNDKSEKLRLQYFQLLHAFQLRMYESQKNVI